MLYMIKKYQICFLDKIDVGLVGWKGCSLMSFFFNKLDHIYISFLLIRSPSFDLTPINWNSRLKNRDFNRLTFTGKSNSSDLGFLGRIAILSINYVVEKPSNLSGVCFVNLATEKEKLCHECVTYSHGHGGEKLDKI